MKFTPDTQIGLSADGTKLILPIPVAAQQGFMLLQSGDAKVLADETFKHTRIGPGGTVFPSTD